MESKEIEFGFWKGFIKFEVIELLLLLFNLLLLLFNLLLLLFKLLLLI